MNSLRNAAQAALEAMDREIDTRRCKASTLRAMIALRAALAQRAEPVADPFSCPKCGRHDYGLHGACPTCDMFKGGVIWHWPDQMPDGTKLYNAPPQQAEPTTCMAEITRLRAERDALADRLREVRELLADTIDRHRQKVVLNAWAEQKLARHGIPMPDEP